MALALAVAAAALCGVLLQSVLLQQKQLRVLQKRRQLEWLVQSGMSRAVEQLRRDSQYRGEVWEVDNKDLGPPGGEVTIRIEPRGEPVDTQPEVSSKWTLEVTGEWPRGTVPKVTRQLEFELPIDPEDSPT